MHNRNEVKWAPFNSLINGDKLIKELDKEHKKISKPILSEDQLETINKLIFEGLTTKSLITIKYYQNGNIYSKKGIISCLNKNNQYIVINNTKIFCNQIIELEFINF